MINVLIDITLISLPSGDHFLPGHYFNGTVGTIHLANTATSATMLVIFIMRHDHFTFEPVEHFQLIAGSRDIAV